MKFFGRKEEDTVINKESKIEESNEEIASLIEKPRICIFDMDKAANQLKEKNYNVYSGSLGSLIRVPNKERYDSKICLLNYDFPPNLHEYDIIVIDQASFKTIDYNPEHHERSSTKENKAVYLLSSYPQTIFDPRPIAGFLMSKSLKDFYKRGGLVITFAAEFEELEYETLIIDSDGPRQSRSGGRSTYSNYSFIGNIPHHENKTGSQFQIEDINDSLRSTIEKFSEGLTYHSTFYHPELWDSNDRKKLDETFYPILRNSNDEVISFFKIDGELGFLVFPQIQNKGGFMVEIFDSFLPEINPKLFPYSTNFKWVENQDYWLPNHSDLLEKKSQIEAEYQIKLKNADKEISNNLDHFKFLHGLLTGTGDKLVKSVERFLKFLEFDEVINLDEQNPPIKEEDLQVTLDDGLLVIEVKGIGGFPKDNDCNQIAKIKYRRSKERNSFDVYALAIINHQRYLPPKKRTNPPFTKNQISDAVNEERGLITTWRLFNLFFEISEGIITKEDAKQSLLDFGLIQFEPSNIEFVGSPKEIHYNGKVVVLDLQKQALKIGDPLFVKMHDRFFFTEIKSIQQNGKEIDVAETGEVGIKIDQKMDMDSEIWRRKLK